MLHEPSSRLESDRAHNLTAFVSVSGHESRESSCSRFETCATGRSMDLDDSEQSMNTRADVRQMRKDTPVHVFVHTCMQACKHTPLRTLHCWSCKLISGDTLLSMHFDHPAKTGPTCPPPTAIRTGTCSACIHIFLLASDNCTNHAHTHTLNQV